MSPLNNLDHLDECLSGVPSADRPAEEEEETPDCPVDPAELGSADEVRQSHARKLGIEPGQLETPSILDVRFQRVQGGRDEANRQVTKMLGLDDDPSAARLKIAPGHDIPHPGQTSAGVW